MDNRLRRRETSGENANPNVIYVDSTNATYTLADIQADAISRSTSWSAPYKYLQNALNNYDTGKKIFVKHGTYYPTHNTSNVLVNYVGNTDSNRLSACFFVLSNYTIYGGFFGDEYYLEDRGVGY